MRIFLLLALTALAAVYLVGLVLFTILNVSGVGKSVAWWRVLLWPLAIFGFGEESGP